MSPLARYDDQHGASAVELALLLPFLLVLVIGVADLGWTLWQRVQLQEAVQEGAVFAAFAPDEPDMARLRVVEATNADVPLEAVYVACLDDGQIEVGLTHSHERLAVGGSRTLHVRTRAPVVSMDECEPSG
jgi:Flp pilus assembly pilin Flp